MVPKDQDVCTIDLENCSRREKKEDGTYQQFTTRTGIHGTPTLYSADRMVQSTPEQVLANTVSSDSPWIEEKNDLQCFGIGWRDVCGRSADMATCPMPADLPQTLRGAALVHGGMPLFAHTDWIDDAVSAWDRDWTQGGPMGPTLLNLYYAVKDSRDSPTVGDGTDRLVALRWVLNYAANGNYNG